MENEHNRSLLNGEFANTMEIGRTMPAAVSSFETGGYFMERVIQALHYVFNGLVHKVKKWWIEKKARNHEQEKSKKGKSTLTVEDNQAFIPVESRIF
ncbi:MAG: hypothetical protein ACFFCS_14885 [Candidatus Hodarchaeota archaeon]